MAGRLAGKVALITGTGGGQGRAAALLFAQEGASVIGCDVKTEGAAETVGTEMHGGTGGLLELTIGALWSNGGRSILALPATDRSGNRSRIVSTLPAATQGTVPRTLVDTVVTEYGIARLWGRTVRERADALVEVAAPQFREELRAASRALFHP